MVRYANNERYGSRRFVAAMAGLVSMIIGGMSAHAQSGAVKVAFVPDGKAYCGFATPGQTPAVFAPGLVSLPGWHEYALCFSPDGRELYVSRWNEAAEGEHNVYLIKREGDAWAAKGVPSFAQAYKAGEPCVSPDNLTIYYNSWTPAQGYNAQTPLIWSSVRANPDAEWSAPKLVGVGMFMSMDTAGGIYVTDFSYLGQHVASAFIGNGVFAGKTPLAGGPRSVYDRTRQTGHPAVSPDGTMLLFDVNGEQPFLSFREANGSWGPAIDLTQRGLPKEAGIFTFSPDSQYVFYQYRGDIWWLDAKAITGR